MYVLMPMRGLNILNMYVQGDLDISPQLKILNKYEQNHKFPLATEILSRKFSILRILLLSALIKLITILILNPPN